MIFSNLREADATRAEWFSRIRFPVLILTAVVGLFLLRSMIWPFLAAFALSMLLEPEIRWVEKKGARRLPAVFTVFFTLMVIAGVTLLWLVPGIIRDLNKALAQFPLYFREIQQQFDRYLLLFNRLPNNLRDIFGVVIQRGEETLRGFLIRMGSAVISVFSQSLLVFLVPVLSFYISRDLPGWRKMVHGLIPRWLGRDTIIFWRTLTVVGAYIRGQLLVSLVVGGLLGLGLVVLEVDLALLIGALAGLFNMIPYFGPVLGAAPAVILAGLESPWRALYVILLFFAVNQLETMYIMPRLVGRRVGLHPVSVIFLLMLGGRWLGLFGMLLAIPIGAVIKVMVEYYLDREKLGVLQSD